MKIRLLKLSLLNFKGLRQQEISFGRENFIYGRNTSGKTTLLDAFLWVCFGKDSTGRSDTSFEIKTLDENNKPFHRLSHEVTATFDVDGETIELRKVYLEKWTKKRGSPTDEFSGHVKEHFWNKVPLNESDYNAKIAALFNENVFKLITNTSYFNSMKWQDRRSVLLQIAGVIADADVIDQIANKDNKTEIAELKKALSQKKSIDEFKSQIYSQKKEIKEKIILIPSRIDEAKRSLPDEHDYTAIEKKIEAAKSDIENVEALLMNKTKAQKEHQENISNLLNQRQEIKQKIADIEFAEKNKVQDRKREREQIIQDKNRELQNSLSDLNRLITDCTSEKRRLDSLIVDRDNLRSKWAEVDSKHLEFNDEDFSCPACKRAFEASDIQNKKTELTNNFNSDKSKKLADVSAKGKTIAEEIKAVETKIENRLNDNKNLKAKIELLEASIAELKKEHERLSENDSQEQTKAIAANKDYQLLIKEIDVLNGKINAPAPEVNNEDLFSRKRALSDQIDEWKKEIASKEIREKILERISELSSQQSAMSQELATLEGLEFCIAQFQKAKMDELEKRINNRFHLVKFKMFEEQVNGGEKETCVTLINGVPYADANTAAKIQAGLDIINTLSDHYGIEAPVWVDNRESVTELPETNCQVISLIVSPKDKKLRVATSAEVMEEVA